MIIDDDGSLESIEEIMLRKLIDAEKQINSFHIFLRMKGLYGEFEEWANEINSAR